MSLLEWVTLGVFVLLVGIPALVLMVVVFNAMIALAVEEIREAWRYHL